MISILYANRNRDPHRIKISLDSLQRQNLQNFEVVFVDYGSEENLVNELEKLFSNYSFVKPFFLPVPQLLWNKSKALNYGIKKASFPYCFIADVDLVFHPKATMLFDELGNREKFYLFNLGYLDKEESAKLTKNHDFKDLYPSRTGNVNGMILAAIQALKEVNGLDEFFHFYGAEDEDLFARLENAGYLREENNKNYFCHNWHQSFLGSEDKLLTGNPRLKNIMRINQRHFLRNREKGIIKPLQQKGMGNTIGKEESNLLKKPTKTFRILNILAHVEHFLREELPSLPGEIVKVEFVEDPYYGSLKHKLKKMLGKQTQPYCSMKEINDMLLKEILFKYKESNYSFKITGDLKSITFCIKL